MERMREFFRDPTGNKRKEEEKLDQKNMEKENQEADEYIKDLQVIDALFQRYSSQGLRESEIQQLINACEFISRFTRVKGGANRTLFNRAYSDKNLPQAFFNLDQLAKTKGASVISKSAEQAAVAMATSYDSLDHRFPEIARHYLKDYQLNNATNKFERIK